MVCRKALLRTLLGVSVLSAAVLANAYAVANTSQSDVLIQPIGAAHQTELKKASEWISAGRGAVAYELLAPLETDLAGVIEFDVLYGQASLQANQPSHAAFAFERCLAVQPDNGICRLGIAKAHIDLQEVASAQSELNILQQAEPPEPVQKIIADYIGQLSGVEVQNQDTRLTSYIQLGIGYDSNINNATARDQMALPLFNDVVFKLSSKGQKKESGFAQARFNFNYSTPIATNWRFLTEANIAATGNFEQHHYNTLVSDLSVGLARRANKHQFIVRAQGQNYRLHDKDYRNLVGVLGQYSYAVTERAEVGLFAQASRLYYPRNNLRNANRYTLGASWTQGLANDRAVVYLSGYGGSERTIKSKAPRNYNYGFAGARTGGMYLVTPRMQLEGGISAENRRYRDKDLLFQKGRRDTIYDAYLGLNYAINRKLSIRPEYRYTHNKSNMVLYDYKRHVVTMNLRYEIF